MRGLGKRQQESMRNARIIMSLLACLCVCAAFLAGFFLRGDQGLLERFGLSTFIVTAQGGTDPLSGAKSGKDTLSNRVAEADSLLQSDSLDLYDLNDATSALLGALSGTTQDEYLRYFDPQRYEAYVRENPQKYSGVGVLFSEYKGHAYAVDIFPGSVAEATGVCQGDFVVAINGDNSQDWSLAETVNALSSSIGDSVAVTWRRPVSLDASGGDEFTTTLACSAYTEPNVTFELNGSVGYIKIVQMTQDCSDSTMSAIQTLTARGATSFVLDIRDNPGGYLTQAVDLASLFMQSGVVVMIETKEENNTTRSVTGNVVTDAPLVVLVNGNTAAAAEVLTAALKDNDRATVLGTTTLGKGSVQVVRPLSFGGALRYTSAYYKSPYGQQIEGMGIVPDVIVESQKGASEDIQKDLAIETAQTLAAG
ncbi:MAG: S41 family peptidase [Eggerthellaceae bacterium]|nr:S41 family peptidase [Eggerthellaceae bacterium]